MSALRTPVIEGVSLDDLEVDPYPYYRQWRQDQPVAFYPAMNGWFVTRWDDCEYIGKEAEPITDTRNDFSETFFGPNILNMGGDPHRFLRTSIDTPLRPKAIQAYIAAAAAPIVQDYVARLKPQGRVDATAGLLELVSVRVVGNFLGLHDVDDATLQRWFTDLNLGLNDLGRDPEIEARGQQAKREVDAYLVGARERYLAAPDESGLSHLLHTATPDGTPRELAEIVGTVRVIILGGFQEPGHAAAASLLGLLANPDQSRAVYADPKLIPAAIHEGLRWIAPFGGAQRRALEDITIGDVLIPAGDEINLLIASANHDESRYDEPEKFDLFRPRLPVASFGYGTHFCAGHFLARELERITLEQMFMQLPNMRLDPEAPPVVFGFGVRGVKHLPIVWDVE